MKKEIFKEKFLSIIENEYFESGVISESETFLRELFKKNPKKTKQYLIELFLDNLNNQEIIVGILRVIPRFDKFLTFPEAKVFVSHALLCYDDNEIQDLGLMAIEIWELDESIDILKNINFKENYLNRYKEQIIVGIERRLKEK